LKDEALGRNLWRTPFDRSYGPVTRQTTWTELNVPNFFYQFCWNSVRKVSIYCGWVKLHFAFKAIL